MKPKTMKVGIMSWEDHKKRMLAIVRGEYRPNKSEPKVWFQSMASMAQVLSDDNQKLLQLIDERQPQSQAELAELSGRKPSNLSRTLKTLERYNIVKLEKRGGQVVPVALAVEFDIETRKPFGVEQIREGQWAEIGAEYFSAHSKVLTPSEVQPLGQPERVSTTDHVA